MSANLPTAMDLTGVEPPGAVIARLSAAVRSKPSDAAARFALAEALILSGAFDRAENQLSTLAQLDATMPVRIARLRHLLRAEVARHAWYGTGAAPNLVAAPAPAQLAALSIQVALREGGDAGPAAMQAEEARAPLAGTLDGQAFDDFRDLDDLCACYLEVLTGDGGYLWVDWAAVASLRFTPPARPLDLLWREVRLTLRDGRAADLVVPAQYVSPDPDDAHRLSQRTDWREEGGLVRGAGQRCFLVGEEDKSILSMTDLCFVELGSSGPDGG